MLPACGSAMRDRPSRPVPPRSRSAWPGRQQIGVTQSCPRARDL